VEALAEHVADLVALIEEDFELPPLDLPECDWIDAGSSRLDIEGAAALVRDEWGLARGPVGHVVRELEAHGIIVSRLGGHDLRVDAFSRWLDDRPLVVLWADKGDKARSRFDASHELGHLVMHADPEPANPLLEKQAHAFASAFLMPRDQIEPDLPRKAPRSTDWDRLFDARRQWGVSIAALFRRAHDVGVLSESAYRRAMIRLSERGMRRNEGDDLGFPEQPKFLPEALRSVAQARHKNAEQMAARLHFPVSHFLALSEVDEIVPEEVSEGLRAVQ
jgi:Zn-dependent peptidase ImmA (M78 family)